MFRQEGTILAVVSIWVWAHLAPPFVVLKNCSRRSTCITIKRIQKINRFKICLYPETKFYSSYLLRLGLKDILCRDKIPIGNTFRQSPSESFIQKKYRQMLLSVLVLWAVQIITFICSSENSTWISSIQPVYGQKTLPKEILNCGTWLQPEILIVCIIKCKECCKNRINLLKGRHQEKYFFNYYKSKSGKDW